MNNLLQTLEISKVTKNKDNILPKKIKIDFTNGIKTNFTFQPYSINWRKNYGITLFELKKYNNCDVLTIMVDASQYKSIYFKYILNNCKDKVEAKQYINILNMLLGNDLIHKRSHEYFIDWFDNTDKFRIMTRLTSKGILFEFLIKIIVKKE